MNRSIITKSLLLSALTLSTLCADDAQMRNLENRVTALEQRKGASGTILPSAGVNLDNDYGVSIEGDLLIWKAHVSNIPYAQVYNYANPTDPLTGSIQHGDYKELHWRFDPGVRARLGYRPGHDDWQINAVWTHFYTKAQGHSTLTGTNSYVSIFYPEMTVEESGTINYNHQAKAQWNMRFNTIDLNLARAFYVSKWLSLTPSLGVRNLWANQRLNVFFNNATDHGFGIGNLHAKVKQNFWGIGPNAALGTKWGLGSGVSIYGDAGVSLLWGFFNYSNKNYFSSTSAYSNAHDKHHTSLTMVDLALGLAWDKNFYGNQYHFGMKAGWEQHSLLNGFQIPGDDEGDLTLDGITISFAFDF